MPSLKTINRKVIRCERCPELRDYCTQIAETRRRAYIDQEYWGKPVPAFGDPAARLLIVGLAPGAHGANRTGRMFTGDRSGDWLYRALHKAGFANQPESTGVDDGLVLGNCLITNICHCAPPGNKPTREQLGNCGDWFNQLLDTVPARVFLALGGLAWKSLTRSLEQRGWLTGRLPRFSHGASVKLAGDHWLLGSYHPSQQNTFTGRLTEEMFDSVFAEAKRLTRD